MPRPRLPYGFPVTLSDAAPIPDPIDRKPRRRAAAVAGIVAVASVIGVGAWAWQFWSAQGPQPAEALPADTLAYVAVDLAPPGGQKVAAYDALRKFPALKKELELGSQDDLRTSLVDEVIRDSGCDTDVDAITSWAGDRAALAVVPVKKPEMVVVVQIKDKAEAEAGLEKIERSCGEDGFGFALGEGWAVLARNASIARQVQSDGEGATLAEDPGYLELTGAAGDAGVVTLYAAPEAGRALLDAVDEDAFIGLFIVTSPLSMADPVASLLSFASLLAFSGDHSYEGESSDEDFPYEVPPMSPEEERLMERMDSADELSAAEQEALYQEIDEFYSQQAEEYDDFPDFEIPAELRKSLEDFSGLGGVARFDDGDLELEVVADPFVSGFEGRYDGTDGLTAIADLPADTAVAFGAGFAEGWGERAVTDTAGVFNFGFEQSEKDLLKGFKDATGLTPDDLEALGGDSIAFAARSGFAKAFESEDPSQIPIAAVVTGDPEKIDAALATFRAAQDSEVTDFVQSRRTDNGVVIGPSTAYLDELADPKDALGDTDRFRDAVPDVEDAITVTFADFDAGDWLSVLIESEFDGVDIAALGTAGMTVSRDGDQYRSLLRITLD